MGAFEEHDAKWNEIARPQKFLCAIEDLGRGAHGCVWLTCFSSGAVCVLKFALDDKPDGLDKEYAFWQQIYPSFPVFRETWCDHPALRCRILRKSAQKTVPPS